MTAWTDAVDATASGVGPAMWYRMGEPSGTTLVHAGSPLIPDGGYLGGTKGETGAINEDDTAVAFTSSEYAFSGQTDFLDLVNECCVACWFKISAYDNIDLISYDGAGTDGVFLRMFTTGAIRFQVQRTTNGTAQSADAAIPLDGEWHFAVGRFSGSGDSNLVEIWLDGVKQDEETASVPLTAPAMGTTARVYFNKFESSTVYTGNVTIDEPMVWDTLISEQDIADLYAAASASNPVSLPMTLQGFVTATSASLPVRLRGITSVPAAGLPMTLQGPDPSHYQATAYRWTAKIVLNDVDVSSQWTGAIRITAEENQSGLATVRLIPSAGALNLADYERKSLTIDFVAVDAAGATLYQVRRYTGRTTTATYNPDSGILAIQATTDKMGGSLHSIDEVEMLNAGG